MNGCNGPLVLPKRAGGPTGLLQRRRSALAQLQLGASPPQSPGASPPLALPLAGAPGTWEARQLLKSTAQPEEPAFSGEQPLGPAGGGFSRVTACVCRETGEQVICKRATADPQAARMLQREQQLLQQPWMQHPNIVRLVRSGAGPALYLARAAHGDLRTYAAQHRLSVVEQVQLAKGLLAGLAHIHGHGVAHGDLAPGNVLVAAPGHALLADFGLAAGAGDPSILAHGQIQYCAPELACGGAYTPASDMWALGCVLFELVTGTAPFAGASAEHLELVLGIYYASAAHAPNVLADVLRDHGLEQSPVLHHPLLPVIAGCLSVGADQRPTALQAAKLLPQ